EVQRRAIEEAQQPFDLSRGPLLHIILLRLSEIEHVALVTMHHIISDGWSLDVLVNEVATLYEAFLKNEPSPLPELSIQYADFAHWQREWLRGEVLESQLAYWRGQLADAPALLDLPTDRPRPALQTFRGSRQTVMLTESLRISLRQMGRREGCTLFMTLLVADKALLFRDSVQQDICVGIPVGGRNHAETEGLIGFFVNTLVLRTNLSGDPTFKQLLRREREVAVGAYSHQDLPFEQVVEKLQPQRDMSHSPF